MQCPRCNQPMHSRSWTHRDGHTDTRHACRNHLCRYRWQSRCDATPAMVAAMRAEVLGEHKATVQAKEIAGKVANRIATERGLPNCGWHIGIDLARDDCAAFRELADKIDANVSSVAIPPGMLNVIEPPLTRQVPVETKLPRPVKVGDVLYTSGAWRPSKRRTVVSIHGERMLLSYGDGFEPVGDVSYAIGDVIRYGWTHADGAAIAKSGAVRREVRVGDELRSAGGTALRVLAATDSGLSYTCRGWTFNVPLTHFRDYGWTFADTGEAV